MRKAKRGLKTIVMSSQGVRATVKPQKRSPRRRQTRSQEGGELAGARENTSHCLRVMSQKMWGGETQQKKTKREKEILLPEAHRKVLSKNQGMEGQVNVED